MDQRQYRSGERGNALIIIFIAIALLAALSFTVSDMLRGDPNQISEHKAELYANEIFDYARAVKQAIQHVRISNECSETEISFENPVVAGYANAGAPADESCHIFEPEGGGMSYIAPSADWMDSSFSSEPLYQKWYFTGHTCIEDIGGDETDCESDTVDNSELMIYLPYIKQAICRQLGHDGLALGLDTDNVWSAAETKFTGAYGETGDRNEGSGAGFPSGCFQSTGTHPASGSYTMYQVLIPR